MSEFHASERCFRRYEPVIRQALQSFPVAVKFKPQLAITTEVARCRDAITSYRRNTWPVPDEALFASLKDPRFRLNVWNVDSEHVLVGDKSSFETTFDVRSADGFSAAADVEYRHVVLEIESLTHLEYIIELIDSGVFPFSVSLSEHLLPDAQRLIGDRLNVGCHVENSRLIIF